MSIKGSVDHLSVKGATGWIFNSADQIPMIVEAVLHHRIIGEAIADQFREDLAAVGLGDGRCGFTIDFPTSLDPTYLPFVSFRPAGGDVELPRTTLSGFSDFLRGLHSSLPKTGRQKSVFGGLWTDRTDALAMLQGRRAIQTLSAENAALIEPFIVHGYTLLDASPDRRQQEGSESSFGELEQATANMLFQPIVDNVLKGILDDEPVITHGDLLHEPQPGFRLPCSGRGLASPLECVALVSGRGGSAVVLELVRDSHNLPDFTTRGDARWLLHPEDASFDHAASIGSSVEMIALSSTQVAVISASTLYRCADPSENGAVEALCIPRRTFSARHSLGQKRKRSRAFAGQLALS